jgi:putative zinc finger/helix-turn-helix YgiT family protein
MERSEKIKICPECETGELQQTKKDLLFTYKGQSKRFAEMKVLICPVCGHERLSEKTSEEVDRELTDFRKSIDGLLSSDELKAIRLKLKLKIKEMADRLSLDAKTVGRYENGKKTQSKQVDMLYRQFLREHLDKERDIIAEESAGIPVSSSHFLTHGEPLTTAQSAEIQISQEPSFHVKVSSMYAYQPSGATVDTTYFKRRKVQEEFDLAA